MKRKIFSYGSVGWGIILLITISILVFYSNCTKKSIRFYDNKKDYYLYATGSAGSEANKWIYIISTETDSLVDSIYFGPYKWPGYMNLSPDKRILYVWVYLFDTLAHGSTSTHYEIDTRTKAIKYTGPNSSTAISPDGKYLFTDIPYDGEFRIFDAVTHQTVYQESTVFLPVCFDKKKHLVYGGSEKGGEVRIFNYDRKLWVRSFTIHLRDGRIPAVDNYILSLDGDKLYLIARCYYFEYYFCVFDLISDSLLIQLGINSGGEIAKKPNGDIVYITDPGGGHCYGSGPPPTGELIVFDSKTNTILPSISLDPLADSLTPPPLSPFFIRITPDGEKAYLSICRDRILVIDLLRNIPLKAIILPDIHLAIEEIAL
jgi:DNA-binding beta-propeller fold protein YncE